MYKVHINGVDYVAPDLSTLQQWAREGRLLPETFVWVEAQQLHRKANEIPGMSFGGQPEYSQPPSYNQAGYSRHISVPNNLLLSILATICCCMPFGIVAIVYSAQVDGHASKGDIVKAQDCATKAKNWAIASIVCGFFGTIAYIALMAASGEFR